MESEFAVSAKRFSARLSAKKDVQRSARHRPRTESATTAQPAHSELRRPRRGPSSSKPYDRPSTPAVSSSSVALPNPRRSLRISPSELVRRENALLAAEREVQQKKEDLALQIEAHEKQQHETTTLLSQLAERDAATALAQLEQHFVCPLCYDIVSAPYTISSAKCGHTFCAICILKWFFSRLHPPCGSWHESVDCPICRTRFITTPEATPRPEFTFPFVPNRLAAAVITGFIDKISASSVNTAMKVKREEDEALLVSASKRPQGRKCSRKAKSEENEEEKPRTTEIDAWREGGVSRIEWHKKEREGKEKMTSLLQLWRNMQSDDFIEWKERLGV
ncbi:hypothetical protein CC2G_011868 [Coprinopsis cinerea AmutBmut pab1-1]|nr:hypothetical protein CC2G_011868 [Coprinopsis cinerea AmutBmut pab1-1]